MSDSEQRESNSVTANHNGTSLERRIPASSEYFVANKSVPEQPIKRLEGLAENTAGRLAVKPLITGKDAGLLEFRRAKGLRDPEHTHPDHESICYLVSGRVRVVIAGQEFIAEPGDAWIHPAGVLHYHETLEDSVQIEIKAPATRTWE